MTSSRSWLQRCAITAQLPNYSIMVISVFTKLAKNASAGGLCTLRAVAERGNSRNPKWDWAPLKVILLCLTFRLRPPRNHRLLTAPKTG